MKKYSKKDLVDAIYNRIDFINKISIKNTLDTLISVLKEKLNEDDEVIIEIRGFGIIKKKKVKNRKVFDFKEKKVKQSNKNYKLTIKPSKEIKL